MRKLLQIAVFLVLATPVAGQATLSAGILNSGRAIPWENVPFSIPSGTWTQCTTAAANTVTSAGSSATAAQVNAAIASCPANTYVLMAAGTYNYAGSRLNLSTSNVVLRGAGPTKTIIKGLGSGNCGFGQSCGVLIGVVGAFDGSAAVQPGQSNSLNINGTVEGGAGVYPQGATHLTVDTIGSDTPKVGTMLLVDQVNDQAVAAGIIQCDNQTVTAGASCSGNGGSFGRGTTGANRRSQTQAVVITNCNGSSTPGTSCGASTTYTVSPGLYFNNMRSSQLPGAWWNFSSNKVTQAGLENITIDTSGPTAGQDVTFGNSYQSWVKNVHFECTSSTCGRSHIAIGQSLQGVVRDSYLHGAQAGGGAEGYGLEPIESSTFLIENNIFDFQIAPWINDDPTGFVFGYNYSWNSDTTGATFLQCAYTSHDTGAGMVLYEGNDIPCLVADNQHGASPLYIVFRNHIPGNQPVPFDKTGSASQTDSFIEDSYARVGSYVGNVLGMLTVAGGAFAGRTCDSNASSQVGAGTCTGASYHTAYEASTVAGCPNGGGSKNIFVLGYGDGYQCGNPGPTAAAGGNDAEVITSLMRWGNCDSVTATCRFVSGEVPTAGGTFYSALSVPVSHTLPASFYYASTPAWYSSAFGPTPFPAFGPDVTGGNLKTSPSGIAYEIPARLCFENTAQDSTNYPSTAIKAFDANNCYGKPPSTNATGTMFAGQITSQGTVALK